MSDEALLILKMVQEGKITPEQGVAFLEALKNDTAQGASAQPGAGNGAGGQWRSVPNAQRVLAQLQQQLAEMQAKLGAAQAGSSASASGSSSSSVKLPLGFGEFNVTSILDETMRGVSALRNEALIGAKRAARQAQKEARRFRVEAERLGKNIHVEVHVRTEDRPRNSGGYPESTAHDDKTVAVSEGATLTIRNPYGDIKIVGTSQDGAAHVSAEKTVWAATSAERDSYLSGIAIDDAIGPNGELCELVVVAPDGSAAEQISVNLLVQVPASLRVAAATTFGKVHCESMESSVSRIETVSGDVRVLHIHDSSTQDMLGESSIETASGAVSISQWRGALLSIRSAGANVQLDMVECPGLQLHGGSSDANLRNLKVAGELHIETMSGDLSIEDSAVAGSCSLKTHSGDLGAAGVRAESLLLETVSGDVTAKGTDCRPGRAVIKAISGDLHVEDLAAGEVSLNTTSGDVDIAFTSEFAGSIAGATVSGDLTLNVPAGYSARLTMTTHSGDLKCAVPLTGQEGDGEHYLTGAIGQAANPPTAMLQSVSGDLCVRSRP